MWIIFVKIDGKYFIKCKFYILEYIVRNGFSKKIFYKRKIMFQKMFSKEYKNYIRKYFS